MFAIVTCSSMWAATLLAGLLIWLVYYYYSSAFSYWAKKGVCTPKPIPFFGNLKDSLLLKRCFTHLLTDLYLQTEDRKFIGVYKSTTPLFMVRDLELIKSVLLKDFQNFDSRGFQVEEEQYPIGAHLFWLGGSKWKNLRVKMTPTFTVGKMKMMVGLIRECCDEMVSLLQDSADREEDIEMKEVVAKFTTEVIGSCAFGLQSNSMKDSDSQFRAMGKKMFTPTLRRTIMKALSDFLPALFKIIPLRLADEEVSEFFLKTVGEIVSYRERNGITRNDFMQLLINLKESSLTNEEKYSKNTTFSNPGTEQQADETFEMTDSRIAAQCYMFFVAGFETSSTSLSCCLYELAMNMDIQDKLTKEIDSVIRKHDKKFTYEALQDMKYMDQVVDETLRRHPPGGVLFRSCTKPYTIPGTNVHLDKNTTVLIPVHGLHHDPKYFPDPEKFDPDRFSEENAKTIPQYAYLPFGEGPRACIGARFGRMQIKACLAALLSQFQFFICERTSIPLRFDPRVPLVTTPTDVWLTIKRRPEVEVI